MTLQPSANLEDVEQTGPVAGYQASFVNRIPDEVEVSTSGGGEVFVSDRKVRCEFDSAGEISIFITSSTSRPPNSRISVGFVARQVFIDGLDEGRIGYVRPGSDGEGGASFDLANMEFHADGRTEPVQRDFTSADDCRFDAHLDIPNNETRMTLSIGHGTGATEKHTASVVDNNKNISRMLHLEASDSVDSGLELISFMHTWHHE